MERTGWPRALDAPRPVWTSQGRLGQTRRTNVSVISIALGASRGTPASLTNRPRSAIAERGRRDVDRASDLQCDVRIVEALDVRQGQAARVAVRPTFVWERYAHRRIERHVEALHVVVPESLEEQRSTTLIDDQRLNRCRVRAAAVRLQAGRRAQRVDDRHRRRAALRLGQDELRLLVARDTRRARHRRPRTC